MNSPRNQIFGQMPIRLNLLVQITVLLASMRICKSQTNICSNNSTQAISTDQLLLVQKKGPELKFISICTNTGFIDYSNAQSLRQKVESADSPFVTDPFMRQAFILSSTVPSKLLVLAMGRTPNQKITTVQENVIMLPSGPTKNVWNLVVWEGSGHENSTTLLLGVMGERFSTLILQISTSALATIAKNISIGLPVRNVAAFGEGRYFFLITGAVGRALVTFAPDSRELDHWADPAFEGLYSLSFDRRSGLLIGTFTVASFATALKTIDWKGRTITDRVDFLEIVPTGSLAPYDASISPGSRSAMVRSSLGSTLVSRDTNASLNLIDLEQQRITSVSVPGLFGFVHISDVTPRLAFMVPNSLMMAGATNITAVGANFGRKDYIINCSITTRSAVSRAEVSWISDSSVMVRSPLSPETGPGPARLTVNFLHGAAAIVTSYEQSWTSMSPLNAPSSGGAAITISGAGFMAGENYLCNWTSKSNLSTQTWGIALSDRIITCKSPSWAFRAICEGYACRTLLSATIVRSNAGLTLIVSYSKDEIPLLLISPGSPQVLAILSGQIDNIRSSAPLAEPYVVAVQDSQGNNCDQGQEYLVFIDLTSCPSNATKSLGQARTSSAVLIATDLQLLRSASGCRLKFTLPEEGLTVYSNVLNVTEGFLSNLIVQSVPNVIYGGIPFNVEVEGRDMERNTIRDSVLITAFAEMNAGLNETGLLKGQSTVKVMNGIGNFTNLVLNLAGNFTLFFMESGSPLVITSHKIIVIVGEPAAVRVKWPNKTFFVSMELLSPPPVVWTVDAGGNPTTKDLMFYAELHVEDKMQLQKMRSMSVKSNLFGKTATQAIGGFATFTNLAVNQKLYGYYVLFSVIGIGQAKSDLFFVLPGPASKLQILRQPVGSTAAIILPTQPLIAIQDEGNNTVNVSSRVSVRIPERPPMNVRGRSSIFAETDLAILPAGTFQLLFESESVQSALSSNISILVGLPSRILVLIQPGNATEGIPFERQPQISVQDAGSNLVPISSVKVSASLKCYSIIPCLLKGVTSATTSGGVAKFSNLTVDHSGNGYRISFWANFTNQSSFVIDSEEFQVIVRQAG